MKRRMQWMSAALGLLLAGAAQGQVTIGNPVVLAKDVVLTNGSTTTINLDAALPQNPAWSGNVQLMAIVGPANATATHTAANYCTNLVLKFGWVLGTHATTDEPFTWSIATDQFGALSATPHTADTVVWTNLTGMAGITGIRLLNASPRSTNTYGPKVTVLVGRPQ